MERIIYERGTTMGFETIRKEIEPILEVNIEARTDDMNLYRAYVKLHGASLDRVFESREYRLSHGIYPFESVGRVRRMIQHDNEDLRPTKEYLLERQRAEKEYLLYAKEKK